MESGDLTPLRVIDWKKTVQTGKNSQLMDKKFPMFFSKEHIESVFKIHIVGTWQKWELTDEGSGQYPIYKCFIEDGTIEVKKGHIKTKHLLKQSWIKICAKIEEDVSGRFRFAKDHNPLYLVDHSFSFTLKNQLIANLLKQQLGEWFKEHQNLLDYHLNHYHIHIQASNDLTLAGWDTAYVTSFTNVNKTIQEKKLFPESFTYEYEDNSILPIALLLDGRFQSWQMTTGADGQNVNFICKFGAGSRLIDITTANQHVTYLFSEDAFLKVQVKLEYFNSKEKTVTDPTGKDDGIQTELKVKQSPDANQYPAVILVDFFCSNELETPIFKSVMGSVFTDWLNENVDKFENIFSYFLLFETAQEEGLEWIKPTANYYGIASVQSENKEPDLDKSVFSVMAMVENHKNEYPQHTVDSRLLQAVNNESAFAIDMPLFVEKWLEEALIAMQIGTLDQFERTNNGMVIKNKERIKFATLEDNGWDGIESFIEKGNFSMGIKNNQLVLEMVDVTWGERIIAHVDYKQVFDLELKRGTDSEGIDYQNVLVPVENEEAIYRVTFTKNDWNLWGELCLEIVIGIGLGILFGIVGKMAGKALDKLRKAAKKVMKEVGDNIEISSNVRGALEVPFSEYLRLTYLEEGGEEILNPIIRSASEEILAAPRTSSGRISLTPGFMQELLKRKKIFTSKLWENKYKLIGGSVLAGLGRFTPLLIVEVIDAIKKGKFSSVPTIEQFVENCVGTVKWSDHSEFKVETAQLLGIYLMGGKLNK